MHERIGIAAKSINRTTLRHEVIKQLVEKKSFKEKTVKNVANIVWDKIVSFSFHYGLLSPWSIGGFQ